MRPGSVIEPFIRPWLNWSSAVFTRASNSSRNSLRGVAGVGSRRAQKRAMNASASASVCSALPGRLLFVGHDVLRRTFAPIGFGRRERGKRAGGRGCDEDRGNQTSCEFSSVSPVELIARPNISGPDLFHSSGALIRRRISPSRRRACPSRRRSLPA